MSWLKQSTAVTVKIGPFVDETDGKTAETALTLSQADIRLSKNGGDMAQKNNTSVCTHDELGYYDCPLSTTDTGTLGVLQLMVHEAGALPVMMDFMVVPANVWDSFFGSDKLQVDAAEVSGDATAADNLEAMLDGTRAKLWLTSLDIAATGNDPAIKALGSGTGQGAYLLGGADANGMSVVGQGTGDGLFVAGYNGINAEGDTGAAIYARGSGTDTIGLQLEAGPGTGAGLTVDDATLPALVWDVAMADHEEVGTTGAALSGGGGGGGASGDVVSIDGSTTAADNLRKFFDGTGYNAANSGIGSVASAVNANLLLIMGNGTAASRLTSVMLGVVAGAAVAGTLSTTEMTTNLTETTDNHWKAPHVVKWVTGNLAGQARAITGYVGATKKLQFQATTEAPAATDQFIIL